MLEWRGIDGTSLFCGVSRRNLTFNLGFDSMETHNKRLVSHGCVYIVFYKSTHRSPDSLDNNVLRRPWWLRFAGLFS